MHAVRKIALLLLAAGSAVAQDSVEKGAKVFRQAGCIACHKVNGLGGPSGPDLTRVGAVRTEQAWLRVFLKDPAVVVPGSRMPPFDDLTEDEVRALTAYLLSLK
jgi:mono/diheme cytochrome c family protein